MGGTCTVLDSATCAGGGSGPFSRGWMKAKSHERVRDGSEGVGEYRVGG